MPAFTICAFSLGLFCSASSLDLAAAPGPTAVSVSDAKAAPIDVAAPTDKTSPSAVLASVQSFYDGTADLPGSSFSLRGYAQWVAGLLDALDIEEPAVVVGHSFGGGVAVRFAHDFRPRVRSLVLVNSIGGSSWRSSS